MLSRPRLISAQVERGEEKNHAHETSKPRKHHELVLFIIQKLPQMECCFSAPTNGE